ncbi:hypothetical protein PR048_028994 [Dryococelus australis]|uniref:Uncharacterized protein n=1 Tax=Dryococelus australis TaxID=614101 RepID=A0ABQ9GEV8_9NEOP|nr:hypothetical protein PR048_028994 [Dryococelus australis]
MVYYSINKLLATKVIPETYNEMKAKVEILLQDADYVSFTTDMWTSSCNDNYTSITAHFADSTLEVVPFPEISNTADEISTLMTTVIKTWKKFDTHLVGCKAHRLVQEEPMRWNSTLHMIDTIIKQKQAVLSASSDLKLSTQLSS